MANKLTKIKEIITSFASSNQKRRSSTSWYQKKRVHPIDIVDIDVVTVSKKNGLKLAAPFIILIIVCAIVAA